MNRKKNKNSPQVEQRPSAQGENLDAEASMEINNIKDATTIKVSSRLQGGMEGESLSSVKVANESYVKNEPRNHTAINENKISDIFKKKQHQPRGSRSNL